MHSLIVLLHACSLESRAAIPIESALKVLTICKNDVKDLTETRFEVSVPQALKMEFLTPTEKYAT